MESVTDVHGCCVYDVLVDAERKRSAQTKLRYTTYTPSYFQKHKDIEIETDLLDASSQVSRSPNAYSRYSPVSTSSHSGHPHTPFPIAQTYGNGHNYLYPPVGFEVADSQWSPLPSPRRSPLPPNVPVYARGAQEMHPSHRDSQPQFSHLEAQHNGRHTQPSFALTRPPDVQSTQPYPQPYLMPRPQIVVDTLSASRNSQYQSQPDSLASSPNASALTPVSLPSSTARQNSCSPYSPEYNKNKLLVPHQAVSKRRSSTLSADKPYQSPSSLKWAEHFGGDDSRQDSSAEQVIEDTAGTPLQEDVPRDLIEYIRTLVPATEDPADDETYLKHYFTNQAAQLSWPDRGCQNPFRLLLYSLCPREPALSHAILAFAATDLAHNDAAPPAKALLHAKQHYEAAMAILTTQLKDPRHEQSTAALATSYFLDLTDVKNVRPISQTQTLLRIVKARSAAGRIYEGGICWTWFNATLGVTSALFGGPVVVMPFLIETDQLPTPGQGNMFPFIKKTEQERIEHTVISPMFISQMQTWVILSKLSVLANSYAEVDFQSDGFTSSIQELRRELDASWNSRAKLIDSLTSESVEEVFLTKWQLGIPIAQQVVTTHHAARLYAELLLRGTYPHDQLIAAVRAIVPIFEEAYAAGVIFHRRILLVPIFLCVIICPDPELRQRALKGLALAAGTEPSWNQALAVAKSLTARETVNEGSTGTSRSYDAIKWSEVRDRLGGIVLY